MKKNLKYLLALCLTIALVFSLAACGQKADETPNDAQDDQQTEQEEFTPANYSIAALKGPTAMGLVKLMKDSESGETTGNEYTFTLAGSADEVTPALLKGELDMACVPANLAAVLYNKTEGEIEVLAVKTVPVASFIILALIWLSSRTLPLFIAALMVFPPVYLNVLEGIRRTDASLLEMARVFRVPFSRTLRGVYLPQVLPYFRSAVSAALGLCWKAGTAAEVIALSSGSIGEKLYNAKIYFQTADLFAWTAAIVLISAAFEKLFLLLVDKIAERMGA